MNKRHFPIYNLLNYCFSRSSAKISVLSSTFYFLLTICFKQNLHSSNTNTSKIKDFHTCATWQNRKRSIKLQRKESYRHPEPQLFQGYSPENTLDHTNLWLQNSQRTLVTCFTENMSNCGNVTGKREAVNQTMLLYTYQTQYLNSLRCIQIIIKLVQTSYNGFTSISYVLFMLLMWTSCQ